eukprot:scaffold3340_cov114-Isochrysis_galbana.AAC.16
MERQARTCSRVDAPDSLACSIAASAASPRAFSSGPPPIAAVPPAVQLLSTIAATKAAGGLPGADPLAELSPVTLLRATRPAISAACEPPLPSAATKPRIRSRLARNAAISSALLPRSRRSASRDGAAHRGDASLESWRAPRTIDRQNPVDATPNHAVRQATLFERASAQPRLKFVLLLEPQHAVILRRLVRRVELDIHGHPGRERAPVVRGARV